MADIKENQIINQMKNGNLENLYYFYGADTLSAENLIQRIINNLLSPEEQTMNLKKFNGDELDMDAILDSFGAFPFLAQHLVIYINGLNVDKVAKAQMDIIRKQITNIAPTTTVLINASGEQYYKSRTKLTDKNERFKAAVGKVGLTCEFRFKTAYEIARIICSERINIAPKTAEYLAGYCLCDLLVIKSELEKLKAYTMGREITVNDINLVCIPRQEADVFSLMDNLLCKKASVFFHSLNILKNSGQESISLVSAMAMTATDIYKVKLGRDYRRTVRDIIEDFKYPPNREFVVQRIYNSCQRYPMPLIKNVVHKIGELDCLLKSVSATEQERFARIEEFACTILNTI